MQYFLMSFCSVESSHESMRYTHTLNHSIYLLLFVLTFCFLGSSAPTKCCTIRNPSFVGIFYVRSHVSACVYAFHVHDMNLNKFMRAVQIKTGRRACSGATARSEGWQGMRARLAGAIENRLHTASQHPIAQPPMWP